MVKPENSVAEVMESARTVVTCASIWMPPCKVVVFAVGLRIQLRDECPPRTEIPLLNVTPSLKMPSAKRTRFLFELIAREIARVMLLLVALMLPHETFIKTCMHSRNSLDT